MPVPASSSPASAHDGRPSVTWINHFAISPEHSGGRRHFELGRELVARGWRVSIIASDFHLHSRSYTRRQNASDRRVYHEQVQGVDFYWLWAAPYSRNDWRRGWNWMTFGWSLFSALRHAARADVLIGSSPHLFAALASERLAKVRKIPFVFEVRDLWPESLAVAGLRKGLWYLIFKAVAWFLYRQADRVIILARGAGEYLVAHGLPRAKLAHVPNGVDVNRFSSDRPLPPQGEHQRFTLVYAGAHGPLNDLDTVLEAASRLRNRPDIQFLFVGDGPLKSQLVAKAKRLQLPNVTFRDPVSSAEIPALFARADAGIMVLRDAPLFAFGVSPNKLFDYLAAAMPVVNNVPGEVAQDLAAAGAGEQAADSSPAALADAVVRLADQPLAERIRKGEAGRAWVRREHGRNQLGAKLDRVLRSLLSR